MAAAQTLNVQTGSLTYTSQGEVVYIINSRTAKYKHIAHVIANIIGDRAVTQCQVWASGGTVAVGPSDVFTWCERGCTPKVVK